jgi:signal transduction histidine kinase
MITFQTKNLRNDFKKVGELINAGEKVMIIRPRNENLVVISEREYAVLEKYRRHEELFSEGDAAALLNHHEHLHGMSRDLEIKNDTLTLNDKLKNDFIAAVAHEINKKIAVIAAASDDTLDILDETPLNIAEIKENQEIIGRKVKMIKDILLDLMDTVAIEDGRFPINLQPCCLTELIKDICKSQYEKLDTNGNTVTYDLEPGLPDVMLDPPRIEQVMINLLSNAFQHTRGGTITVKVIRAAGSQIVSVADNGEGMDEEIAKNVFRQYASNKKEFWRHGLGLPICRRIILAHDGEIWLESVKGRGTTVFFSLGEEAVL